MNRTTGLLLALTIVLAAAHVLSCRVDRRLSNPARYFVNVQCKHNAYHVENLCDDEKAHLDWAAAYTRYPALADLSREALLAVTTEAGDVDRAAAVFYHRVISDRRNADFLNLLERREKAVLARQPDFQGRRVLLAIAPGMFYKDNPDIGADGRVLRKLAQKIGMKSVVIPLDQSGTVTANGAVICDFVRNESWAERIIIASVSKAGGDVKLAVAACGKEPYFQKVIGWYNLGGINRGSLLVNVIDGGFLSRLEARLYFWYKNYDYEGMLSMRAGPKSPLDIQLEIPPTLTVVNVVALPFTRHVTERARPFYEALLQYGPNDGLSLTADSIIPGGVIYPSFRNDHYFQWPVRESLIIAFLSYLVDKER